MNVKIFSNTYGHFLESTFSLTILGQNNGNAVQCHLGDLQNDNIRGVGQTRVKQGGCTFSKSNLDIASGEEKGALG
jgi:hypothetical protein